MNTKTTTAPSIAETTVQQDIAALNKGFHDFVEALANGNNAKAQELIRQRDAIIDRDPAAWEAAKKAADEGGQAINDVMVDAD